VVEDIADIVQNIKKLSISLSQGETAELFIEESGNKVITAGDIKTNDKIKINNPDLVIATLTGGTFIASMDVNIGKGYIEANEHEDIEEEIGLIAVDSIYSPIEKVKFEVETITEGNIKKYDKIIIDVFTNGAIDSEDSIAYASKILKDCYNIFSCFEEIEEVPEEEDLSEEEKKLKEILSIPIEELEFTVRSANCLREADIKTIGELATKDEADMLKTRNFGKKSLREIREKLDNYGLTLGMVNLAHLVEN
jgi:DNA-directed RNA polymerase subunit alpha